MKLAVDIYNQLKNCKDYGIRDQVQRAVVSISSNSGAPGSAVEIRIRGASTIEFDKTPLYIINGNVYCQRFLRRIKNTTVFTKGVKYN